MFYWSLGNCVVSVTSVADNLLSFLEKKEFQGEPTAAEMWGKETSVWPELSGLNPRMVKGEVSMEHKL